MDVNAMRIWGIAVSAVLMTTALAMSMQPRAEAQSAAPFEVAQVPAPPEYIGFIVRFRGEGPIARAQALAARGDQRQAQDQIEAQLVRQTAFRGLCFDRFTVGGAEVVLRSCQPVTASERAAYQERWVRRLRAMRAVAYADANVAVPQNRAG
ncbi:MAG: hypothetical protein AB7Q23_01165 [Hyphomonadaceae bacterium]